MVVFLSFALLVLAGAVVLLFAMLGELTARLPTLGVRYRDPAVAPLTDARIGVAPSDWPAELDGVADHDRSLLVVLSTACASCDDVAAQLSEHLDEGPLGQTAVLVSCADAAAGREFIERHALARMPAYVDEGGLWVSERFGVRHSPTALVLRGGRLESALIFADFAALQGAIPRDHHEVRS